MTGKSGATPPLFEDLKTSTKTIMCYTNVQFDLRKVFTSVEVAEISRLLPHTKKNKNIDKKAIRAPPGSIVSMHYQKYLRGVNLRKMKKYCCEHNYGCCHQGGGQGKA